MDMQKIGSFIAQRRKALGMTQQQLADKLFITDRAVSKWERGAGLPDISLLVSLSEALDVGVGELLAGERIDIMSKQKADEITTTSVAAYSDNARRRTWRNALAVLPIVLALVCALLLGIGQFTKNALPSYSALENMAKTNKMLQAFKQGDSETLRGMMPDGVYIEGAGIAMPGTENTAGSLHQPMLVVEGIDPDSAGHVTVAYLVYTQEAPAPQTTSDKIWLMQRWLQDGEMRYRFKGFGYEDGVYYAEYALSFLDADGNAVHKASLWAKWDGDHVVSLHLKVDSAALITLSVVEVQPDS